MQTETLHHDQTVSRRQSIRSQRARFAALPLHYRFAFVGSVVSLIGMLIIGDLVSDSIETGVVRNSAISSAVYMESFIAPLSQELADRQEFSDRTIQKMRTMLEGPPLSERVLSVKIWREGGFLAFASDADLIGQTLPPGDDLREAWSGELSAAFDELEDIESARERATGVPLLEVYNPIHSIVTGEVIAVAEFYIDATELRTDLRLAKARAWAVVALVTAVTFAALFGIVRAGSRTIAAQTRALAARLDDLARVSSQNKALRERVQMASRGVSETNERYMRRVSAELHDGPAQALALAALRFDALMRRASVSQDDLEARNLRATLDEALTEIRDLCRGLTLPELEGRSLAETLDLAIGAHERRTGVAVQKGVDTGEASDRSLPHPILICVYRFVQEGLMNAFRHASGAAVRVGSRWQEDALSVWVEDDGPGFDPERRPDGLGLAGLRERVESLGGEFRIEALPERGTRLSVLLPREVIA